MNREPTDYECFGTYPQADGQTLAERDCFHCVYATGCAKITPQPKTTMTDTTTTSPLGRKFDGGKPGNGSGVARSEFHAPALGQRI